MYKRFVLAKMKEAGRIIYGVEDKERYPDSFAFFAGFDKEDAERQVTEFNKDPDSTEGYGWRTKVIKGKGIKAILK
jgi:hypothetical protein